MITYSNRYSNTDKFDKMGRWARLAIFKNIKIGWINKHKIKDKLLFTVSCYFPTMSNDTANEHKVCNSLDEAKDFIEERWEWFLNEVS